MDLTNKMTVSEFLNMSTVIHDKLMHKFVTSFEWVWRNQNDDCFLIHKSNTSFSDARKLLNEFREKQMAS